jgi:chromosome segregation ATPase
MKNRIGLVVMALVSGGLAIALVLTSKQASNKQREDANTINTLSNNWVTTSTHLDDERQVAAMLQKDLQAQKSAYSELTNSFSRVSGNLSQVASTLAKTEASLKQTEGEVKKRDAKIAELANQNQVLDKQALDLSTSITNLTTLINETQRKLAASEGDKAYLEKELKRLIAEKAELERQFNDLAVLRAQVTRLKEELSIARRVEWIRRGLFASSEEKGATKLLSGVSAPQTAKPPKPNYDLNVEISSQGDVRVLTQPTNTPAPAAPVQK